MGVHSTMVITAEDARIMLRTKLLQATDEELGRMMDAAFYDTFYNFSIVPNYDGDWHIKFKDNMTLKAYWEKE